MPVLTKINSNALGDSSVTSAKVRADVIAAGDLAPNSVDSSELVDGSIDASHISANAIVTAGIASNAVTNIKLADEGTLTQSAIKRSIHKAWVMGG